MTEHFTDIVVGAGASGCIVAARLSDDPSRRVLLLEAGPDYGPFDSLPAPLRDASVPDLTTHDWGLLNDGIAGRSLSAPRGRVVGGSSAINTCIALRAHRSDFDGWPMPEWAWSDVVRGYEQIAGTSNSHTTGPGMLPLVQWDPQELTPLSVDFLQASRKLGFTEINDLNASSDEGVGTLPMNRVGRERYSSARAFLDPLRSRDNLEVRARVTVTELFTRAGGGWGVVAVSGETKVEITSDNVVLCAGAYGTPAILLASGIGPDEAIDVLGRKPILLAPGVGQNLHDHPQTFLTMATTPDALSADDPCAQVLLRASSTLKGAHSDLQISILNRVDLPAFAPDLAVPADGAIFMAMVQFEQPRVRGTVRLAGLDMELKPIISLNFLREDADRRALREGLRLADRICQKMSLAREPLVTPTLTRVDLEDDDELDRYLCATVQSGHHPGGTARMGSADDPLAVTDSAGRVYGTFGLYVADASVLPRPIHANTHLTCILIGDRIARGMLRMPPSSGRAT